MDPNQMKKEPIHYVHPICYNNHHRIHIGLVGVGGTGSLVLRELARINMALINLDRPGINVTAYDSDFVSLSNVGRQLFSENDIGTNKAVAAISKVNRAWGYDWKAIPERFDSKFVVSKRNPAIIISAVDSVEARRKMVQCFSGKSNWNNRYDEGIGTTYYLIDSGNGDTYGQIQVMTFHKIRQPKKSEFKTFDSIKSVLDAYKGSTSKPDEPSCSLAQALGRQDLMTNLFMATTIASLVWKMLHKNYLTERGAYINVADLTMRPIPLE